MTLKRFWQIILLSCYSSEFYLDVANKWRHWGLGILIRFSILVGFISSLLFFIIIYFTDFSSPVFDSFLKQIPELKIENNMAQLVDDQIKLPFTIKFSNYGKDSVVVDLDITKAEKYQQNIVVFTKDRISINSADSGPVVELPYAILTSDLQSDKIDSFSLTRLLKINQQKLFGIILMLGIPIASLLYFSLSALKALFYASMANIIVKIFNYHLSFKQLIRIAVVINIPTSFITSIFLVLFFNNNGLIQVLISNIGLFYFIWVIVNCERYYTNSHK